MRKGQLIVKIGPYLITFTSPGPWPLINEFRPPRDDFYDRGYERGLDEFWGGERRGQMFVTI